MSNKRCTCCHQILSLNMFTNSPFTLDGKGSICKPCHNARYNKRHNSSRPRKGRKRSGMAISSHSDIRVEEGKQFSSSKEFIKFKRSRLLKQTEAL